MQFLCGTANSFTRLHAVQRSAPECFIAAGVVFALRSSLCVDSSSIYESQFSDFLLHARRVVPALRFIKPCYYVERLSRRVYPLG